MENMVNNYKKQIEDTELNFPEKVELVIRRVMHTIKKVYSYVDISQFNRINNSIEEVGNIYYHKLLVKELTDAGISKSWIQMFIASGDSAVWLKGYDDLFVAINKNFRQKLNEEPRVIIGKKIEDAVKKNKNAFLSKIMKSEMLLDGTSFNITCYSVKNMAGEVVAILGTDASGTTFEPLPDNIEKMYTC